MCHVSERQHGRSPALGGFSRYTGACSEQGYPSPTAKLVVPGALQGPAPAPPLAPQLKRVGSAAKQQAKDAGTRQLLVGAAKRSLVTVL